MRKAILWLALLSATGLIGWWLLAQSHTAEPPQTAVTRSPLALSETQELERALNSSDPTEQAKVMAPELAQAYLGQQQQFLPNGAQIKLQPETFTAADGTARVEATLVAQDGSDTNFMLVLARDSTGSWKLLNTERK